MGGIAIVRPARKVFGFNSGNVSLSAMRSFSPFSCTCLAGRNARRVFRLGCTHGGAVVAKLKGFYFLVKRLRTTQIKCS